MANRNGRKWAIPEILSLQREYQLLEMSIQEIAAKHQRTVESILFKLYNEKFISEFEVARGYPEYFNQLNKSDDGCEEDENTLSQLEERINRLESSMNEVKYILSKYLKKTPILRKSKA
jgi:hypothetical protein